MEAIKLLINHSVRTDKTTVTLSYYLEIPKTHDWWDIARFHADMKIAPLGKVICLNYSATIVEEKLYAPL